jgi:hypothetical protein
MISPKKLKLFFLSVAVGHVNISLWQMTKEGSLLALFWLL